MSNEDFQNDRKLVSALDVATRALLLFFQSPFCGEYCHINPEPSVVFGLLWLKMVLYRVQDGGSIT
jgi:hypothetical protein